MSQDEKSQPGSGSNKEGSIEAHQKLVHEILEKYGALHHIRLWKNATGRAKSIDGNRYISFGLKGSADILGIHYPSGKLIAIECKTGDAKPSKGQKAFGDMITKFGGIYILARSISDVYLHLVLRKYT